MQRASDGWWESSHPTTEKYGERGLCGKLAPPHCELIGLWECKDEAEEKALHEQFNEGVLKRKDCHNEFYEETEWPKIYRELCTWFTPLPLPAEEYPPVARERTRKACSGGRSYWCKALRDDVRQVMELDTPREDSQQAAAQVSVASSTEIWRSPK